MRRTSNPDNVNPSSDLEENRIDESLNAAKSSSLLDIDVDLINESLAHVNNFSKRRPLDKVASVLMYEITSDGETDYKNMTLRELLNYVNDQATSVEEVASLRTRNARQSIISAGLDRRSKLIRLSTQLHAHNGSGNGRSSIVMNGIQPISKASFSERDYYPASGTIRNSRSSISLATVLPSNGNRPESFSHSGEQSPAGAPLLLNTNRRSSFLPPLQQPLDSTDYLPDDEDAGQDQYDTVSELRLRDLRRLDFQSNPAEERSILIRKHAVLFAMVI